MDPTVIIVGALVLILLAWYALLEYEERRTRKHSSGERATRRESQGVKRGREGDGD